MHKLFDDYLDLVEKYSDLLPVYEFGFAMIKFNTKLLYDMAPNPEVAKKTIDFGIEEGVRWHKEIN